MRTASSKPQLISYPDSLGGSLASLREVLATELDGVFSGGLHLLPPFPSSGDRGFAPMTYDQIAPEFGDWDDIAGLAELGPLVLDVMVNHMSRQSPEFKDFEQRGRESEWADLFITLDKIWATGKPAPGDLDEVALRKPDNPFSVVPIGDGSATETIWTTFGFSGGPVTEQIDIDINSALAIELFDRWFGRLAAQGATTLRLDAVGYLTKRPRTRCFMNEPEIWEHLDVLTAIAGQHNLQVLPEVHDGRDRHLDLARRGHLSYDFALPGLVLDGLLTGSSARLVEHLGLSPEHQVTMLDCHDGTGVNPDLRGLLSRDEADALVAKCVERGANLTLVHHEDANPSMTHQINMTFAAACGSDAGLLVARSIQMFAPGQPQVYYVGLLAGDNDPVAVEATGEGRAINRHNFDRDEIATQLALPVVQRQIDIIRLRNDHPAFEGALDLVEATSASSFSVTWRNGEHWARLDADLADVSGCITTSDGRKLPLN
ncbi:MAG: sucrose phosphorylase [Acidimicrobiales bacterium]